LRSCTDWDLVVVVSDFVGPLSKIETHPGATLPGFEQGYAFSDRLDITVFHESYWRKLLYDNAVMVVLCTAIPKSLVLLEKAPVTFTPNYQRLKSNFYLYVKTKERKAQTFWKNKNYLAAKKQFVHGLRATEISMQIVDHGKITDMTSANKYWFQIRDMTFSSFSQLHNWFNERYAPLYDVVTAKLNVYKSVFERFQFSSPGSPNTSQDPHSHGFTWTNQLGILDYLQHHAKNDLDRLDREVSVHATYLTYPTTEAEALQSNYMCKACESNSCFGHARFDHLETKIRPGNPLEDLILLERQRDSPRHFSTHEAYRLVIHRQNLGMSDNTLVPDWRVIAMSPPKYWEYGADKYVVASEKFVGVLDPFTARVYEKTQGIGVLLFWHQKSLRAVVASSGSYSHHFAQRHGLSAYYLGHFVGRLFWKAFRNKGFQNPPSDKNWTFQFSFHPEEDILQLDAIMDNNTLIDISMYESRSLLPGESSTEPLLEVLPSRLNWNVPTRIVLDLVAAKVAAADLPPSTKNVPPKDPILEAIQKATNNSSLSFLRSEGLFAIDRHGVRAQCTLPQYQSLQLLASPFERKNRTRIFLKIVRASLASASNQTPSGSTITSTPASSIGIVSATTSTTLEVPKEMPHAKNAGISVDHRFCLYFPEWASWHHYIEAILQKCCIQLDASYESIKHIEDRDSFQTAGEAISVPTVRICWKLRTAGLDALSYFTSSTYLNEVNATNLLHAWVEEQKVFADAEKASADHE
jgi:hypothetical protein